MSPSATSSTGLILAATALEIKRFLEASRKEPGRFDGWDVLITGPGLMAATYQLSHYISLKRPAMVIQAGIAGSFDPALKTGTVVAIKEDRVADEGVLERTGWHSMEDLGLRKKNQFPFKNGWLKNDTALMKQVSLKKCRAITINQISAQASVVKRLREQFNPTIESMEGAALHYVCLMENIPFLQLRAISNQVGVRDKRKWNFSDSIANLNHELISLLDKL